MSHPVKHRAPKAALPPGQDPGKVQATITRGWNAYMVQVCS